MKAYNNLGDCVITSPSAEELRPSNEMRAELQRLLDWEKRCIRPEYDWSVGEPCPFG